mmetsp:Transcript_8950/g.24111  ORF Transcript_8950/g.24111 Transcript_8950/m.24111 type:complete len:202 (+) Transcript_8950:147-752(+)
MVPIAAWASDSPSLVASTLAILSLCMQAMMRSSACSCRSFLSSSFDFLATPRSRDSLASWVLVDSRANFTSSSDSWSCRFSVGDRPSFRRRSAFSALASASCCLRLAICAATGSLLTMGLFLIARALLAYRSEFNDSSMFTSAGETQAIIKVLLFPPRESCSILVSFESLYGTCCLFSDRALITLPSASSPLLILIPSCSL